MNDASPFAHFSGVLAFLATAGVIVPLFRRLRISPVLGFILAGLLLGRFGLGALSARFPALSFLQMDFTGGAAALAELGVVFLLFMIGLELSFERLRRLRALVFGLGLAQIVLCAVALGVGATFVLHLGAGAAAIVGAALALSSTAIVVPALAERRRLGSPAGRAVFSVLLAQDLMVAPLLFMAAMLGGGLHGDLGRALLYAMAPAAAALALIVGAGRLLLRPLFHQVAQAHSTEFFVAACLFVVIGAALIAAEAGLSMALGAFIAGLLLAETEFRREIEVAIEPFKGLLLGLFFISTGAGLDLGAVVRAPLSTIGIAIGLTVVKAAIVFALAKAFRLPAHVARETALLLGPGGEFAFVLLAGAVASGLLHAEIGSRLIAAVTLSMAAIPALAALVARAPVHEAEDNADLAGLAPAEEAAGRVLVVGYGRVGKLVGDLLDWHKKPFIAVDGAAAIVRRERLTRDNIYWGDATRLEFLRKCDIAHASALVVTLDAPHACERVVELARAERPDLTIIARARDAHHATHLYELGATDAIPETIEASLQLSEAVLVDIGVPMGFVIASIHEKRDEFRKLLSGDDNRQRRAVRVSTRVKDMARRHDKM